MGSIARSSTTTSAAGATAGRRARRRRTHLLAGAFLAVTGGLGVALLAAAGPAGAGTAPSAQLYVSTSGHDTLNGGRPNTCQMQSSPCQTIQHAVDEAPAGATVNVAAGTYSEQVAISTSLTLLGSGSNTIVALPASTRSSVDATLPDLLGGSPVVYGIAVTGGADVTVEGMSLQGNPTGNGVDGCSDDLAGVAFEDASGSVQDVDLSGWSPASNVGCGSGHGVLVESANKETSTVSVAGAQVSGYGKSGIFAAGSGTVLNASGDTVTGTPTGLVATNGIEIDFGATGTVTGAMVTGNDYTGTAAAGAAVNEPQANYAAGILFYGASGMPTVQGSMLSNNQIGVESVDSSPLIGGPAGDANTITESATNPIPDSIGIYAVPCDVFCASLFPLVVAGQANSVTIQGNTVNGIPDSYDSGADYRGSTAPAVLSAPIWVGNTAAADADGSITATITDNTVSGGFVGILLGPNSMSSSATVTQNIVTGFERTGIQGGGFILGGDGLSVTAEDNIVTGQGAGNSDPWAQNGIELANGATGTIEGNTVSGFVYTAPNGATLDTEATAIVVFESSNVAVLGNTVADSQVGIAVQSAGFAPNPADWSMRNDTVTGNVVDYDKSYQAPGTVQGETAGTWGIWPASYCADCSVSATIGGNTLAGPGAATSAPSVGIQVGDTAQQGAGGSFAVDADGNAIVNWSDGINVVGTTAGKTGSTFAGSYEDLAGDTVGVANATGGASGTVSMPVVTTDDWWGCAAGPGGGPTCASVSGAKTVTAAPYLASLSLRPTTAQAAAGTTVTETATLLDSNGNPVGSYPILVGFATVPPVAAPTVEPLSASGTASYSFTDPDVGTVSVSATAEFGSPQKLTEASGLAGSATVTFNPVFTPAPSGPPSPPPPPAGATGSASGTSSSPNGTATAAFGGVTGTGTGEGSLTVAAYPNDPVGAPTFTSTGEYFDVQVAPGSTFSSLTVTDCNLNGGDALEYWSGTAWVPVTPESYGAGPPACVTASLSATSTPTIGQLTGTVFAVAGPAPTPTPTPTPTPPIRAASGVSGYWLVGGDGGVFAFGGAGFFGSLGGRSLAAPVVGLVATPDGGGYWLVARDGGVFAFGDARFFGSLPGLAASVQPGSPVVGLAATPDGGGYWEVTASGDVYSFGDAQFFGSLGGERLAAPIDGIAPGPNGQGYWLAGTDGGVFAFGDAAFDGSLGGVHLNAPIVGIAAS